MEKEFVPHELSLRMKQLGFDEPCFGYFDCDRNFVFVQGKNKYLSCEVSAPLYQQAFRWLIPQIDDEYRVCFGEEGWYVYNLENNTIYENEKSLEKLIVIVEQSKSE